MTPLPGPWQKSLSWQARLGLDCNTSWGFIFAAQEQRWSRRSPLRLDKGQEEQQGLGWEHAGAGRGRSRGGTCRDTAACCGSWGDSEW